LEARTVLPQTSSEAILKPQTAGQILVAAKGLHWGGGDTSLFSVLNLIEIRAFFNMGMLLDNREDHYL